MLRYIEEEENRCVVFFDSFLEEDDYILLLCLFEKGFENITLDFTNLYTIQSELFEIIMKYNKQEFLKIITHKKKLHRYLYKLGCTSHFYPLTQFNTITKNTQLSAAFFRLSRENDIVDLFLEHTLLIYGYDLRNYQRTMIQRRIEIFMNEHNIADLKNAILIILHNKRAFKEFLLEISINVSSFFRNPNSYKSINTMLKSKLKNFYNIKVWSAGCSDGEEAYSLVIMLKKLNLLDKSVIYATDFNPVILQEAKNALYSKETYQLSKENYIQCYNEDNFDNFIKKEKTFFTLQNELKKKVFFFQHDLVRDGSFNEFNIIVCKNVLIYFDKRLQKKIFQLFYDSLYFGGYLVLGESEIIHKDFCTMFEIYDESVNIYQKVC